MSVPVIPFWAYPPKPTFPEQAEAWFERNFYYVYWPAGYVIKRYIQLLDRVTLKVGASLFNGLVTTALIWVLWTTCDVFCQRVWIKAKKIFWLIWRFICWVFEPMRADAERRARWLAGVRSDSDWENLPPTPRKRRKRAAAAKQPAVKEAAAAKPAAGKPTATKPTTRQSTKQAAK